MTTEKKEKKKYDRPTQIYFERRLVKEKIKIMAELQRNGDPILIENLVSNTDKMAKTIFVSEVLGQQEMHGKELQDIEDALQRIDEDVFGTCIDCGELIILARLEAMPTAKRCVSCQVKHAPKKKFRR